MIEWELIRNKPSIDFMKCSLSTLRNKALRTQWSLSTILKKSNKSLWSNAFWYVKEYTFWKFIQYTIHWDKPLFFFGQNKRCKKSTLFFFRELQLTTVLLLIHDSYMSWNTKFVSLKVCVGFSISDSVMFLLKFIFLFNKKHGLFDFTTS